MTIPLSYACLTESFGPQKKDYNSQQHSRMIMSPMLRCLSSADYGMQLHAEHVTSLENELLVMWPCPSSVETRLHNTHLSGVGGHSLIYPPGVDHQWPCPSSAETKLVHTSQWGWRAFPDLHSGVGGHSLRYQVSTR